MTVAAESLTAERYRRSPWMSCSGPVPWEELPAAARTRYERGVPLIPDTRERVVT